MPPKDKSESREFLKVGEAVSQGLHDGLQEPETSLKDLNGAFKALSDTATAMVNAWNKLWDEFMPMFDRAAKDPRTPRLTHLARYGKNRRIRKKNAKRLFHIMKGD